MKAVNLGLSVMWGDCNIGAKECYDEGNLYTWNEIMPEIDRGRALRAPVAIPDSMKCNIAERMHGYGWQVPQKEHIIELMQKCEFEFVQLGLKTAVKVTGPNGNSIYLPLAGNRDWNGNKVQGGFYWTSTKAVEEPNHAYQLRISDQMIWGYNHINVCQSVRPIFIPNVSTKKNYNLVRNPLLYSYVDYSYIQGQIVNLCRGLNIPFSLSEIQNADRNILQKIPMIDYAQVLKLNYKNELGHGNITFVFTAKQRFVGLLIEGATKEYIDSVKNCGMVYGIILGEGSITYGADRRTDTVVKLNTDEIYVRLY
jgi:hypothetical protein